MTENIPESKIYYCEEKQAICLTDSCANGKELLHYPEASQDIQFYEGDGYAMSSIPGTITTHVMFKDGTEKCIAGNIGILKGCESKSKYSKEFLAQLKQLCLEFDSKAEAYPDPDYIGFALYYYATHPGYDLRPGCGGSIDLQAEYCEGGDEWMEALEKGTDHKEVTALKLPDNHFIFHMTIENIDEVIKSVFNHQTFKKGEFFKDDAPAWLADSFLITQIEYDTGSPGTVEIYPLDELVIIDVNTGLVLENKDKHENTGLIIYSN